ncbi:hypothetical protein HNQ72_003219 [Rhizobium wenxiniae]|uniref:Uncharacterized protein n=1 Tax=Rhizobium wenxiniae TaxID=1737357 RepID=A0A7W9Y7E4_9HYPH|nr:hypothetical protein [Rhizobium wenxiniae]MBB6163379.1 hypothetical protein [Rhizobium wenxiniae]
MGVWNALGIFGLNILIVADALLASAPTSHAQQPPGSGKTETESVNSSNNPLDPLFVVNLQNYYIPKLEGLTDRHANVTILRALTPFEIGGAGNLLRTSVSLVGRPDVDGALTKGIGDLTLFDILVMQTEPFGWGLGPLLVAPPLRRSDTGAGKWQAGAAAAFTAPQDWACSGGSGPISGHLRATEHDLTSAPRPSNRSCSSISVTYFIFNLLAPDRWISKTATTTRRLGLASENTGLLLLLCRSTPMWNRNTVS